MSLKMAEDSEWDTCVCDTPTASVAVCQHPWNAVNSGRILTIKSEIFPKVKICEKVKDSNCDLCDNFRYCK